MENNRLQVLPKNVFKPLGYGWYLNLKNNEINEINPLAFYKFGSKNDNRHQIHLENNLLKFISREALEILIPLR